MPASKAGHPLPARMLKSCGRVTLPSIKKISQSQKDGSSKLSCSEVHQKGLANSVLGARLWRKL